MAKTTLKALRETKFQKYLKEHEWEIIKVWLDTKLHSPPSRMVIYTMTMLGLRVGEAVRLKRIQFTRDFSVLRYKPLKKKQNIIHEVAVPKVLQEMLKDYHKRHVCKYRDGFMFYPYGSGSKNNHVTRTSIDWIFKRMREELDLLDVYYYRKDGNKFYRISPHTMRHFFAYRFFIASGHDHQAVKERLCHEELNTTSRYINSLMSSGNDRSIVDRAFS